MSSPSYPRHGQHVLKDITNNYSVRHASTSGKPSPSTPQYEQFSSNSTANKFIAPRAIMNSFETAKTSLSRRSLPVPLPETTKTQDLLELFSKQPCSDLIFGHNTNLSHTSTFLCIGNHHGARSLHTCIECENTAYQNLTSAQQELLIDQGGAHFPLCADCGIHQLFKDSVPVCLCLVAGTKCSQCLFETLDRLIVAKERAEKKAKAEFGARECFSCDQKVSGSEEIGRGVLCYGIKAPLSEVK